MQYLAKKLIILTSIFGLLSCDMLGGQKLEGSIDRTGKQISTTVYFYDTVEEVQQKYIELHNLPKNTNIKVQGFAKWPEYRSTDGKPIENLTETPTCVIHTVRPTQINDEHTLTLGHEMLHCIIGTYHPEPR